MAQAKQKKVSTQVTDLINSVMRLMAQTHQIGGSDVLLRAQVMENVSMVLGRPLAEEGVKTRLAITEIPKIGVEYWPCTRCLHGRYQLTKKTGAKEWVDCINCTEGKQRGMPGYMHISDCERKGSVKPKGWNKVTEDEKIDF